MLGLNDLFNYCYVAKFSSDGVLSWIKRFEISTGASIIDLKVNSDDEILVLGYYNGTVGQKGPLFAKFGPSGNLLWMHSRIASSGGDYWKKLVALPDGGAMAIGSTVSGAPQVIRISAAGSQVWRTRPTINGQVMEMGDLAVIDNNNIFIGGGGLNGVWLLKINMVGEILWAKVYSVANKYVRIGRMIKNGSTLTMVGGINDPNEQSGILWRSFTAHFDLTGNLLWNRTYQQGFSCILLDLTALPDGGYFAAGNVSLTISTNNTVGWLVKMDALGFAGSCPAQSVMFTPSDASAQPFPQMYAEKPSFLVTADTFSLLDITLSTSILCEKACPTAIEICNNNLDDDGDGLFDCLDPECPCTIDECHPKRNDKWYFGTQLGLDFATEPPTILHDGKTNTGDIDATISDQQGNLLFYTDGKYIFNRFHQIMPHGTHTNPMLNILEVTSIIIPHPGNPALYYVFIHDRLQSFTYSLIDMRLDNGKGDVVTTEQFVNLNIPDQQMQGLTATRSCNFNGYWLALSSLYTKQLIAYRIDQNGLNQTPVISSTGDLLFNTTTQLKFSPSGKQLARSMAGDSLVLYDFDLFVAQTGQFTNPRRLQVAESVFFSKSLEYSPTGRYLYVSCFKVNTLSQVIYQFDLEAGDITAIEQSRVEIISASSNNNFTSLQSAPNGKIYVAHGFPGFDRLDIINQPDAAGLACQYQESAIVFPINSGQFFLGFNNCITSDFLKPHIAFLTDARNSICTNTPVAYQIKNLSCDVDSIHWTWSGNLPVAIQDNYQYASVTYLGPGQGDLIVTAFTPCGVASDTLPVTVFAPTTKILNLGPDRTVCDNGVFTFNAGSGFAQYRWQNGLPDSVLTTILPGKYWVDVFDQCGNRQTDTVVVKVAPTSVLSLGPDILQCAGLPVTFQRPAWFTQWAWSPATGLDCDTCATITAQSATTTSWTALAHTADGCLSLDTLHWIIADTLRYTRDTTICAGQSVDFYGVTLPPDTTAIFHFTGVAPGCDTLVTVHVFGLPPYMNTLVERICPEDSLQIYGTTLRPDTTAVFYLHGVGCDSIITVEVKSFPPVVIFLPADTSILIGDHLTLPAAVSGSGALSYSWQPGGDLNCTDCLQPVASPLSTITYALQVTNGNGCAISDSIVLRVNSDCQLLIPNAFTPNGDGVNDWFYPSGDPCLRTVRLWQIRNRWGQVVFERRNFAANQQDLGWDGRFRGKDSPSDVLVWVAEFEYYDGRVEQKKGEVVLLR